MADVTGPHPSPVDPAEVREVLAKWLRHVNPCHFAGHPVGHVCPFDRCTNDCTCGLNRALASLSAPVPPEPQLSAADRTYLAALVRADVARWKQLAPGNPASDPAAARKLALADRLAPPSSIDTSTEGGES